MREKAAQFIVFETLGSLRFLALWPCKLGKCSYRARYQKVTYIDQIEVLAISALICVV
jgi:hypothetical protein